MAQRWPRSRMAPDDAWYVFAKELHSDQLLVYGFTGRPASVDQAVEEVVERARSCPDLRLRVRDRIFGWGFPSWISGDVERGQVVVHDSDVRDWPAFLRAASRVIENDQLDTRQAMWRLHIFLGVNGVPGSPGQPSTMVIVQISHALADGMRASTLAAILFGRREALPLIVPLPVKRPVTRNLEAARARRELIRDTEAGLIPRPRDPVPALLTNTAPTGTPILRTFVRHRTQLPGKSATIGALIAISEALSGYLRERGEDPSSLTALVPMANPGVAHAFNHSGPEFISLHPETMPRAERAQLIAAEIVDRRRRRQHVALAANTLALTSLPGPVLRWVQSRTAPPKLMAHTVVSSINRGADDLTFGGCPVIMTAGYPFLTPTIGLTHGIHGIGEKVAISVCTTESVISDIEEYIDRLNFGLRPQL